jgi:uncharacterized protein (DUF111 family)
MSSEPVIRKSSTRVLASIIAAALGNSRLMARVSLRVDRVRRHGLRARRVRVEVPDTAVPRSLSDITGLLDAADLPAPVGRAAAAVFDRLARVEAAAHGIDVEDVHFHEVGALDSIVDVVGCVLALHSLSFLSSQGDRDGGDAEVVVSPIAVGRCASGLHRQLRLFHYDLVHVVHERPSCG